MKKLFKFIKFMIRYIKPEINLNLNPQLPDEFSSPMLQLFNSRDILATDIIMAIGLKDNYRVNVNIPRQWRDKFQVMVNQMNETLFIHNDMEYKVTITSK